MKKLALLILSILLYLFCIVFATKAKAQNIGINATGATPNSSAMLDIDVSALATKKGLLIPRVTNAQKTAMNPLPLAAQGLIVYQTDGVQGFYYNTSTTTTPAWSLISVSGTGWSITGNAGTSAGTNFVGTTDNVDWVVKTNNTEAYRVTTAGYVGLGTTLPSEKLEVQGNIAFPSDYHLKKSGQFNIIGLQSSNIEIGEASFTHNGDIKMFVGNSRKIYFTGSSIPSQSVYDDQGQLGLGIISPSERLEVDGNIAFPWDYHLKKSGQFNIIGLQSSNIEIGEASFTHNGDIKMFVGNSRKIYFTGSSIPSQSVYDDQGQLGLGVISPSERLEVDGNIAFPWDYHLKKSGQFNIIGLQSSNIEIGEASCTQNGDIKMFVGNSRKIYFTGSSIASQSVYNDQGQLGLGTTSPSERLDVNGKTKTTQLQVTTAPVSGYILTSDAFGNATWQAPVSASTTAWALVGNAGTTAGTNFVGTTDAKDLVFKTTNTERLRILAAGNVGIGTTLPTQQLEITANFKLPATTAATGIIYSGTNRFIHRYGTDNFFAGVDAGNFTLSGSRSVGIGVGVLSNTTTGCCNVGIGYQALLTNTTGFSDIAIGYASLGLNTTGTGNTAVGINSLFSNTTGSSNVAYGYDAAYKNTVGIWNTAIGVEALYQNTGGVSNTAIGHQTMYGTTTGGYNIGIGDQALASNTTGGNNISLGYLSGVTATNANANVTGNYNIFMGYYSGPGSPTQLSNAIAIGKNAIVNSSNTMVLGGTGADILNVGIGTSTPTTRLEVAGQIKITGGTPGVGKALVSDAVGLASWQTLAGLGTAWGLSGNAGTTAGTNFIGTSDAIDFVTKTNNVERIRVLSTGNIGIGSATAPANLTIAGTGANPTIPGASSTGILRVAVSGTEGLDIGKMASGSYAAWMQSGYSGSTVDPLSLNPLGGNVGVATSAPTTGFDVNTSAKIGVLGTVLTNIIKSTNNVDVTSIAANTSATTNFTVTNAVVGSTVSISPNLALANGLLIAYARVSAANTVEVKFTNITGAAIDPAIMDYYITVIK